jgi:hypothetical protein
MDQLEKTDEFRDKLERIKSNRGPNAWPMYYVPIDP